VHEHAKEIYFSVMADICADGLASLRRANEALNARDARMFFRKLTNFLWHAGRVSRFLWPGAPGGATKQERKAREARASRRAAVLRSELALNNDYVLRQRDLRDLLEHLEEQLDEWVESSTRHNFADCNLGAPALMGGSGVAAGDNFRLCDPQAKRAYFRGREFDIQALASGLSDLATRIQARKKPRSAA
jgi:hypothetical protein